MIVALLALLCYSVSMASGLTLAELRQQDIKIPNLSFAPYNRWLNAGIALVMTYSILGTFVTSVALVAKSLGHGRRKSN